MLCSSNGALNCWNSVERRVFVCSRDVIYGLVLNASYQLCAGTCVAAAHGICSDGHWGTSITMCHSRARWCPTAKKSSDRKGRRRAKETGEVDGLYKATKKNTETKITKRREITVKMSPNNFMAYLPHTYCCTACHYISYIINSLLFQWRDKSELWSPVKARSQRPVICGVQLGRG